jgi:hypothetical protein
VLCMKTIRWYECNGPQTHIYSGNSVCT